MSHSFGEGYATRSDEEGFGGIYGGNQSFPKADTDKDAIDENHPGSFFFFFFFLSSSGCFQFYFYPFFSYLVRSNFILCFCWPFLFMG